MLERHIREFGYRKPRVCANFHLWLQTGGADARVLDARCRDLSEDGLAAELNEPLAVGTCVEFVFTLPNSPGSFHLKATVASQNDCVHGFNFIYSSQAERDFIDDYLVCLTRERVNVRVEAYHAPTAPSLRASGSPRSPAS